LQIPEAFLPKEIVIDLSGSPLRSLPFATLPLGDDPERESPSGGPVSAHARDQRGASMNGATFYPWYHSVVATIYIPPVDPSAAMPRVWLHIVAQGPRYHAGARVALRLRMHPLDIQVGALEGHAFHSGAGCPITRKYPWVSTR
jgi:hypothetical protein